MMEAAALIKGLIFLLGGGTAATLIKFLRLREINRRKREAELHKELMAPFELSKVLESKLKVQRKLNEIVSNTSAVRAGIGRFENGGKLARVGSPLYVTAVDECFGEGLSEISSSWEKQRIDNIHQGLFIRLLNEKQMDIIQSTLADCPLKTFYNIHGIKLVRYYELVQPYGLYFYLAIAFETIDTLTPKEEDVIRTYFSKIKNVYEKDYAGILTTNIEPSSKIKD